MKKIPGILMLLAAIVGSTGTVQAADEGRSFSQEGFTFVLPQRWSAPKDHQPKGRRKAKEKILLITKDGLLLDRVEFKKRLVGAEFEHTTKVLTPGMMPQEMAEVVLNDFEMNERMKNFRAIENKPAIIAGIPGFRLLFSYRQDGALAYQSVYYGFIKDDLFYSVRFSAPKRHYYDANVATFERIVKSFTFVSESGNGGWNPGAGGISK